MAYTLTGDNRVIVDVEATADALTPVDIAPAPAFNLDGAGAGDVLEHMAQVQACAPARHSTPAYTVPENDHSSCIDPCTCMR